jgi:hypothetical protein
LNSSSFGPSAVSISPAKSTPRKGVPRRASSASTGVMHSAITRASSAGVKAGAGE